MIRLTKIAVATVLLTLASSIFAAPTSPAPNVSPAERAKIEAVVHQYLLQKTRSFG